MITNNYKYLLKTKAFHNKSYKKKGLNFQRIYPNEDVIRFLKKYFKKKEKKLFLELGCGSGRHLSFLANEGHLVHGLDFSEISIKLLKKEKKKSSIKIFHDFIPGMKSISKFKYDGIIDCFTSYTLIQKDYFEFLKKIKVILKTGGRYHGQLLSSKSDLFKKYKPSKKVQKNSLQTIERVSAPFPKDKYLFTFYEKKSLIKKFKLLGFKEILLETHSRSYRNGKEYFEYFVISFKT
jgi:SAM-dependent methyltransferase